MGWTKRQFVEQALDELGLSPFTYQLTTEQLTSALRRLDTLMAHWNAMGLRLGYPLPSSPGDSDLDEQTSVPDRANEAIIANLAMKIAPSYGKQVTQATAVAAKQALNTLFAFFAPAPEMQLPGTMPAGAGNKPWRTYDNPFLRPPVDPVAVGPDSILELE